MKRALSPAVAAMTLALGAPAAMAATQIGEHVAVSGFGTIGAMVTDNDGAQYRSALMATQTPPPMATSNSPTLTALR